MEPGVRRAVAVALRALAAASRLEYGDHVEKLREANRDLAGLMMTDLKIGPAYEVKPEAFEGLVSEKGQDRPNERSTDSTGRPRRTPSGQGQPPAVGPDSTA